MTHTTKATCPISLPVTKAGFDWTIQELRKQVKVQYAKSKEGQDPKNPLHSGSDPFAADWLPTKGAMPAIPWREQYAAARRPHPMTSTEGLPLEDFMLSTDRLLAMTLPEIQSISYIDGWLFKFALEGKFDLEFSANKFLQFRTVIKKHNLHFNYDKVIGACFNGMVEMDPCYLEYVNTVAGTWVGSELDPAAMAEGVKRPPPPEYIVEPERNNTAKAAVKTDGAPPTVAVIDGNNEANDDDDGDDTVSHASTSSSITSDGGASSIVAAAAATSAIRGGTGLLSPREPVLYHTPRLIDWKSFTLEQYKQYNFYLGCSIIALDYFSQVLGGFAVNSGLNNRMKDFSKQLFSFQADVALALPFVGNKAFACNEGWFFTSVLGPLLKVLVNAEKRKKIVLVKTRDYKEVVSLVGKHRLPKETGGDLDIIPAVAASPGTSSYISPTLKVLLELAEKGAPSV